MAALVAPAMSSAGHPPIQKNERQVYFCGNLFVSPHLSDTTLAYAYLRFLGDGTLRMIFHESDEPTPEWFLAKYKEIPVLGLFRRLEDGESADLLGLGWIGAIARVANLYSKAEVGFATFRHVVDHKEALRLGMLATQWAFENIPDVAALYGTTPEPNRAMLRFFRGLGFQDSGVIPMYTTYEGKPCGVVISYLTRETWEARER